MSDGVKLTPDIATIRQFVTMLADEGGQVHLVAIDSRGQRPVRGQDFGRDASEALNFAVECNRERANIYWTVNLVRDGVHKKPAKADIVASRFAHVDIDPPKDGGPFDKAKEVARLERLSCPPSFILDSGGGLQAFWRLSEVATSLDDLEALNCAIRDACGGDNCQNIDRIMRVPGTVNWLDARKRARGRIPVLSTIVKGWNDAQL